MNTEEAVLTSGLSAEEFEKVIFNLHTHNTYAFIHAFFTHIFVYYHVYTNTSSIDFERKSCLWLDFRETRGCNCC